MEVGGFGGLKRIFSGCV